MENSNKTGNGYKWNKYKEYLYYHEPIGLSLDISCMNFSSTYFQEMEPAIGQALCAMEKLEKGAIANPDEKRMVGHYWLRDSFRAPDQKIQEDIRKSEVEIKSFARKIRAGDILSSTEQIFTKFVLIGIGGSALGPQLLSDALGKSETGLQAYFLDNTDPDGMERVFDELRNQLEETLVIVVSKSGGTVETRNGMHEVRHIFEFRGLDFAKHSVAVTMAGSKLDQQALAEGWLARFYIWDWVGGRTSITSAVGLLPMALQDMDIDAFLRGAKECDEATRRSEPLRNPAAMLALMWYYAVKKSGKGNMVILPYRDSLQLFSRYLQQLIMESLGKEKDLNNQLVYEGITVFGNKGSTDQHAYVQQLLDGVENSFVNFIEVKKDQRQCPVLLEEDLTSGDYLKAFLEGTRRALSKKGRESLTISLDKLNAYSLGALIALFERTVGLYAALININAYHQPGVELGKKVANLYIDIQRRVLRFLREKAGTAFTAEEIAKEIGSPEEEEFVYKILEHLYMNRFQGLKRARVASDGVCTGACNGDTATAGAGMTATASLFRDKYYRE